MSQVVVWRPNPGPQTELLRCPVEDIFYGGQRGGGKTDGLLGDFAAHAGRHGSDARGILFRRSMPELDEVIRRSKEIYGPLGWTYQEQKHDWTAPNGATLRLRYLDRDSDADSYQGHSYTWMGFDELGNWPDPAPIDKLWACLRSANGVPCVRRSTGNPGGPGHVWVKKRYRVEKPLQVFEYCPNEATPSLKIKAVFIPSRLEDNPPLMADGQYERVLAAVGNPALYRAWRYGDWDVLAGQYFDLFDRTVHVYSASTFEPKPWFYRWLSADWGYQDETAIHWHCMDEDGRVRTYRELVVNGKTPEQIGNLIVEQNSLSGEPGGDRLGAFFLSPDAFHKRTSPRTIADEIGEVLRKARLPQPTRADDDRIGGWMLMYQLLANGTWKISDKCPVLIESLPLLQRHPKKVEDIDESPVDHAPDSARYGLKTQLGTTRPPVAEKMRRRLAELGLTDLTDVHLASLKIRHELIGKSNAFHLRRHR